MEENLKENEGVLMGRKSSTKRHNKVLTKYEINRILGWFEYYTDEREPSKTDLKIEEKLKRMRRG